MKSILILPVILVLLISGCSQQPINQQHDKDIMSLKLSSPAFENNGKIPSKFTCDGQDIIPPLQISGVPKNAKSVVLIVDDPDAPNGRWIHWTVWNIAPQASKLGEGSFSQFGLPPYSVQGRNDFQQNNYGGPCPPSGTHRYFFKLYALDIEDLNLPVEWPANVDAPGMSTAKVGDLEKAMQTHILEKAELVGKYERQ